MDREIDNYKLKGFEEMLQTKFRESFLKHPINDRTLSHIKDTIFERLDVFEIDSKEYDFKCRLDEYSNTMIIGPGNKATEDLYKQLNWQREK